jgi:hypothetical protein
MADVIDINRITSDKVDSIQKNSYVAKEKRKAGFKNAAKGKERLDLPDDLPSQPSPLKQPITEKDTKRMAKAMASQEVKKGNDNKKHMLRKLHLYAQLLPDLVDKSLAHSVGIKHSEEEIKFVLDEVRETIAVRELPNTIMDTAVTGFKGLEWVVMDRGFNPLNMDIRGLAAAVQANPEELQPELTEIAVELHSLFKQNCFIRFGFKVFHLCKAVDAANKGKQAAMPVGDDLEDKYSDI